MAERCPHCGLPVVGALAVHIAYSTPCYGEQLWDSVYGVQPLNSEDET